MATGCAAIDIYHASSCINIGTGWMANNKDTLADMKRFADEESAIFGCLEDEPCGEETGS